MFFTTHCCCDGPSSAPLAASAHPAPSLLEGDTPTRDKTYYAKGATDMSDSTRNTDPVPSPTEVMARFGQEVLNDKNVGAIDEIAAEERVPRNRRLPSLPGPPMGH